MRCGSSEAVILQELVKEPLLEIPKQYVQENQLIHNSSSLFNANNSIPTIDMNNFIIGDPHHHELDKLHSACKDWGFFQLVNHGVRVRKLIDEIEKFFKLPIEERIRYKVREGEVEGYGPSILKSKDQKIDWHDKFYMTLNPTHGRKSHLLPQLPCSLRESMEEYFSEVEKLAMKLIELMGKALISREMKGLFEDGKQSVGIGYYPPCPQPHLVNGISPHTDAAGLTITLQLNGVDGLQVHKDGVWVPLHLSSDVFSVNIGNILEILSNGIYKSAEHKVAVNSEKERISITMFYSPKMEVEIGPAESLITPQNPPMFKRISMENFVKDFFSFQLNGKSYIEHLRLKEGVESSA